MIYIFTQASYHQQMYLQFLTVATGSTLLVTLHPEFKMIYAN